IDLGIRRIPFDHTQPFDGVADRLVTARLGPTLHIHPQFGGFLFENRQFITTTGQTFSHARHSLFKLVEQRFHPTLHVVYLGQFH
ncbi:hypothetical protein CVH10_22495, partial [Halomonas sp. ND22Bw]